MRLFVTCLTLIALCNAASLPVPSAPHILPSMDSVKHFHQSVTAKSNAILSTLLKLPNVETDVKAQSYLQHLSQIMGQIDAAEQAIENDEPVLEAMLEEKYVSIMKNLKELETKMKTAGGEKLAEYKAEYAKLNETAVELKAEKLKEAEDERIKLEESFVQKLTELSAKVEAIKTTPVDSLHGGDSCVTSDDCQQRFRCEPVQDHLLAYLTNKGEEGKFDLMSQKLNIHGNECILDLTLVLDELDPEDVLLGYDGLRDKLVNKMEEFKTKLGKYNIDLDTTWLITDPDFDMKSTDGAQLQAPEMSLMIRGLSSISKEQIPMLFMPAKDPMFNRLAMQSVDSKDRKDRNTAIMYQLIEKLPSHKLPTLRAGDGEEESGLDPMLLMLLMGDGDIDPMMLMLMMGDGDIDPMMLMLMMGDDIDPMLLLATGALGGDGGEIDPLMLMLMMGDEEMDPMMLMLLMGDGDIDPMMMMLMMGDGDIDPLMMMLMMGDGDIDPMMLMLLMGGLGGDEDAGDGEEESGLDPMLLMLLMGDGDIDPMMLMLLMGDGDIDPMMMMLMMGDGDIDPMMMMLMMGDGDIDPMMMMLMMGDDMDDSMLPLIMMMGDEGGDDDMMMIMLMMSMME